LTKNVILSIIGIGEIDLLIIQYKKVIMSHVTTNGAFNSTPQILVPAGKLPKGEVSALLAVTEAMQSSLKSKKDSFKRETLMEAIKQSIEQELQGIHSISGKKALLDFLKKAFGDSTSETQLKMWVNNFDGKIGKFQEEIAKAIIKYKEALAQLEKDEDQGRGAEKAAKAADAKAQQAENNYNAEISKIAKLYADMKKHPTHAVKDLAEIALCGVKAAADKTAWLADKAAAAICHKTADALNSRIAKDIGGVNEKAKSLKKHEKELKDDIKRLEATDNPTPAQLAQLAFDMKALQCIVKAQQASSFFKKVSKAIGKGQDWLDKHYSEFKKAVNPHMPDGIDIGQVCPVPGANLFHIQAPTVIYDDVIKVLSIGQGKDPLDSLPSKYKSHMSFIQFNDCAGDSIDSWVKKNIGMPHATALFRPAFTMDDWEQKIKYGVLGTAKGMSDMIVSLTSNNLWDRNLVADNANIKTFNGAWISIQNGERATANIIEKEGESKINIYLQSDKKARNEYKNTLDQMNDFVKILGHLTANQKI